MADNDKVAINLMSGHEDADKLTALGATVFSYGGMIRA
jgi:hypothetical protein